MDTNSEVENEEQNDQSKQPKVLTAKVHTTNVRIICIRRSKAIFFEPYRVVVNWCPPKLKKGRTSSNIPTLFGLLSE